MDNLIVKPDRALRGWAGWARGAMRRAAEVATAGALTAAGLVATAAAPASAHPGVPSAVFDPKAVAWVSVHDLTSAAFATAFKSWSAKGYLVVDLEVDVTDGNYRVGAVFQRNTDKRDWRSLRDLTAAQYAPPSPTPPATACVRWTSRRTS